MLCMDMVLACAHVLQERCGWANVASSTLSLANYNSAFAHRNFTIYMGVCYFALGQHWIIICIMHGYISFGYNILERVTVNIICNNYYSYNIKPVTQYFHVRSGRN